MKKHFLKLSAIIIISAIVLSCINEKPGQTGSEKAIELNNMDKSVNPGDDFYEFAVGGWRKRTAIPDEKSSVWIGDETVNRRENELLSYFDNFCSQHNFEIGSIEEKLGNFYCTGIDSAKREKEGLNMLKPVFDKINNVRSYDAFPMITKENKLYIDKKERAIIF